MVTLESVYKREINVSYLYDILKERTPVQSISHKEMPTFDEHCAFVQSHQYLRWDLIKKEFGFVVGSIYLTKNREIGVFIFNAHKGNGYATDAIKILMAECPGKFLANVNPKNEASRKLFEKLGGKMIQVTYEL